MLQAIRRSHRFGQRKTVHVYHYAALNTIDVDVLENRERSLKAPLREHDNVSESADGILTTVKKDPETAKLVQLNDGYALAPMSWIRENVDKIDMEKDFKGQVQLGIAYQDLDNQDLEED